MFWSGKVPPQQFTVRSEILDRQADEPGRRRGCRRRVGAVEGLAGSGGISPTCAGPRLTTTSVPFFTKTPTKSPSAICSAEAGADERRAARDRAAPPGRAPREPIAFPNHSPFVVRCTGKPARRQPSSLFVAGRRRRREPTPGARSRRSGPRCAASARPRARSARPPALRPGRPAATAVSAPTLPGPVFDPTEPAPDHEPAGAQARGLGHGAAADADRARAEIVPLMVPPASIETLPLELIAPWPALMLPPAAIAIVPPVMPAPMSTSFSATMSTDPLDAKMPPPS